MSANLDACTLKMPKSTDGIFFYELLHSNEDLDISKAMGATEATQVTMFY